MTPEMIELAILVLRGAIKAEPVIAEGIHELLSKAEPTHEDFQKLRDHTASLPSFKLPE